MIWNSTAIWAQIFLLQFKNRTSEWNHCWLNCGRSCWSASIGWLHTFSILPKEKGGVKNFSVCISTKPQIINGSMLLRNLDLLQANIHSYGFGFPRLWQLQKCVYFGLKKQESWWVVSFQSIVEFSRNLGLSNMNHDGGCWLAVNFHIFELIECCIKLAAKRARLAFSMPLLSALPSILFLVPQDSWLLVDWVIRPC